MLRVKNRFQVANSSLKTPEQRVKKSVQKINISGDKVVKVAIGTAATALLLTWAGVIGSFSKNSDLKGEIKSKVSSNNFRKISDNSDTIAQKKMGYPCLYEKANEYLKDVKDSLGGKKVKPFEKHNLGYLLKK